MKETGCLLFTAILGVFVLAVFLALPTMWLWNALIPDITKNALTEVSFLQALGLNFLCGILFKSNVNPKSN